MFPLMITVALLGSIFPIHNAVAAPIVLGSSAEADKFATGWTTLIYNEAFKRVGVAYKFEPLPMARRTAMEDSGEIDGDVGRTSTFGAEHPNLIRVAEPFGESIFNLYTANPALKLKNLDDLKGTNLNVEYRRGILFCEKKLKALQIKNLADVSTEQQAISKLASGRTDVYCDTSMPVRVVLNSPEFRNNTSIRVLVEAGSVPLHTYLHKKHDGLATKLSAALKQMKTEGLIEKYRLQVEKELGMTR